MSAAFEPIAIVGRSCVLPGAHAPEELWGAVHAGRDLLSRAPEGRWGLPTSLSLTPDPERSEDRAWSDRGGYVQGFEPRFAAELATDPFPGLASDKIVGLDPLFQLVLHTGRRALREAGHDRGSDRVGAVFGNLSFPSSSMARFAESVWLDGQPVGRGRARELAGVPVVDPRNRFMSGLPAHTLARALGLGGAYALDAACASSLYAIKLACDQLHDRATDLMLAGAVCRADDLFIHVGFCALQAMSKTGRSRPFHREADGLVPAEGAAFVALKRLSDAVAAGDRIFGVIRGVGLSNDGRGRGLLAPSSEGQIRAMRDAYAQSGLSPRDVSLAECHATGTTVGDATEIASMAELFRGHPGLPIGSLKSNLGHLITSAGAAGLLKVLSAMEAGVRPPSLHAEDPNPALAGTPFRVLTAAEPWEGRRVASISAFGFGGNNAHLLVTPFEGAGTVTAVAPQPPTPSEIAIVRVGAAVADGRNVEDFARDLFSGADKVAAGKTASPGVRLPMSGLRFPPRDLEQSLAQQTLALQVAFEAVHGAALPRERTLVLIGAQADPEVARYGARWRLRHWATAWGQAAGVDADAAWVTAATDAVIPVLRSAGVVGNMPNIPANRLNSQLDLAGPSYTVAAEELSGVRALQIAARALRAGEADAAVVGATDLSCEPVHRAASAALGDHRPAGDAAVVLVLKRLADARRDGDTVLAVLTDGVKPSLQLGPDGVDVDARFGHAHAASGLVHVAAAALSVALQRHPGTGAAWKPAGRRVALVQVPALEGASAAVLVAEPHDVIPGGPVSLSSHSPAGPTLDLPSHPPQVKLPALGDASGTQAMAPAPSLPSALEDRPPALSGRTGFEADAPPPGSRLPAPAPARSAPAPAAAVAYAPAAPSAPTPPALAPFAGYVAAPAAPAPQAPTTTAGYLAAAHTAFLAQQAAVHQRFLQSRQLALAALAHASQARSAPPRGAPLQHPPSASPFQAGAFGPAPVAAAPVAPPPAVQAHAAHAPAPAPAPVAAKPVPATLPVAPKPVPTPAPAKPVAPVASKPTTAPAPKAKASAEPELVHTPPAAQLPGPKFDRKQLEILASEKISRVFGPMFAIQDDFPRQVRMPEPPLLLADRVTGIDAEPGSMKLGTIWTETDVTEDKFLHDGVMPAGVMIESGQADLLLISWLGADFHNKGARVYRLLGCELTYSGGLPRPGETLQYDIHVDGHANQGNTRIFFFHYDCRVNGAARLKVREGQAGFFTDAELANSGGILWSPETGEHAKDARVDAPKIACTRTSFSKSQIEAFAAGDAYACFGPGFEYAQAHVRTPRISPRPMLFMDRVTHCAPNAGPWGRGYLRAEQDLHADDWFFAGHFKDDPCMPGTLMFEGCLQTLAFYMASLGYTVAKDGWRFEPVMDVPYALKCRGQAIPSSKLAVYEVFVEEVLDGMQPTVWADFLVTVDGLKAFHARRVGLRLVPDYPITSDYVNIAGPQPARLAVAGYVDPKPVAVVDGFKFGFRSLMACAWGRPSEAFGPMYTPFDTGRQCARLPGPPYHFMTRLTRIDGPIGGMKVGTEIELEYDVPPDAWYYDESGCRSMPFCVLLEAALQPCGWIACYIGSALTTDQDLFFRNLDGTATWKAELFPQTGTLRTVAKITNISHAGGMIIEGFEVTCYVGDTVIYVMKTVFGFFPREALANQVGITPTQADRDALLAPSDFSLDLTRRPERYVAGKLRLPGAMLLMLDRIRAYWPKGGKKGLGRLISEKDVDPAEWFFKCHFYSDPVQPGSLGLEALVQLIQFFTIHENLHEGMKNPRFEPLAMGLPISWKYRGQVVPRNKVIRGEIDIVEVRRDDTGVVVIADGYLWVDDLRIYGTTGMAIRVVDHVIDDVPPPEPAEEVLDPKDQAWLGDHRPTWTLPALPAMSMVDRMAAAVTARSGELVTGVEGVQVHRWLVLEGPTRVRVELGEPTRDADGARWPAEVQVWREARNPALSRFEAVANGTVITGAFAEAPRPFAALTDAAPVADPYAAGRLFHGPAFQLLRQLAIGHTGSSAVLDAGASGVPFGALNQGLLDALTHAVPHDDLSVWSESVGHERAAYPWRIEGLRFFGPPPRDGEVRVEARFEGFVDDAKRHPITALQASTDDGIFAELRLAEVLVPKGPVGAAEPARRVAFLRDRAPADGLGLSTTTDGVTTLRAEDLRASDWLPGTVRAAYAAEEPLAAQVAVKDHVGRRLGLHPSFVQVRGDGAASAFEPLTRYPVAVTGDADVRVADAGPAALDLTVVREHWDRYFGLGRWPVEDLYYGLIERFVGRVHVTDPAAFEAVRGRSLLYVGNHQTGVESLLFSILASGLTGVNTVTLAKMEHKSTWLGRLIALCFSWPKAKDPEVITFFDRADKRSLPAIVQQLAAEMAGPGKSVMVHVEGTRSLECRTPVAKMGSLFIDMALGTNSPIVPVRFVGGLPVEPLEKRLEFPVGMGTQDIWFGRPILPEELASVGLRDRKELVVAAVNATGPSNAVEAPNPGDPALAASVDAWMAQSGASHEHATLLRILQARPDLCEATQRVVDAATTGTLRVADDAEGRWLAELAGRLFGERGPTVIVG